MNTKSTSASAGIVRNIPGRFSFLSSFKCLFVALIFMVGCSDEINEDPNVTQKNLGGTLSLNPFQTDPIVIQATSSSKDGGELMKPAEERGRFDITLKYITPVTERQQEVFEAAKARWERIIIGDVPSITPTTPIPSAFFGFPPVVEAGETLDDIIIEVAIASIDGPGGILGQAGPRFARSEDYLTLSGVMFFDVADLAFLDQLDLFEEVIVHEMGHVLGVGSLWRFFRTLREGPVSNPYFTGKYANVQWGAEGGTGELPIENMGGAGTRLSHWRESALRNELMTGFLNLGENPLSRITAASMRDLGYTTAVVGEQYELAKGTPGVDLDELDESALMGIYIADQETILEPVGLVQTN